MNGIASDWMRNSGHIYRIRMGLIVLAVTALMLLSVFTVPVLAQGSVAWTDYGRVFHPATAAYYPSVLYDASAFSGHGDSYYYKMWYSTGTGIRLASSNDGKAWTAYNSGLDLSTLTNAHHSRVLYDAGGFDGSGVFYKIWYWNSASEYVDPIRYAESLDGIHWSNDQAIGQDPSSPLVTGWVSPYWFYSSYGPSDVLYNPDGYAMINDAEPMGNKYVMYYDAASQGFAPDGTVEATALAYSADGQNWKRYGSEPVLKASGGTSWDSGYAYGWRVLKWDGMYRMWYSGGQAYSYEGVGYAESYDGLVWTKGSSNPIQVPGASGSWNDQRDYTPMVIYDANEFGGHGDPSDWKMYYSGGDSLGNKAIGYKTGPWTTTTATGMGKATFSTNAGGFSSVMGEEVNNITPAPPAGLTFPDGLLSFTISGLAPGATVTVTITLPSPLPAGSFSYWKFQSGAWTQFPSASLDSTRTLITLTFTADAIGTVTDPGGPAITPSSECGSLSAHACAIAQGGYRDCPRSLRVDTKNNSS